MLADVLIPRTSRAPEATPLYTYAAPAALAPLLAPGQLVAVPFGARTVAGLVWALDASDEMVPTASIEAARETSPRQIASILLHEPLLPPVQRALAEWLASYYAVPLGTAARLVLPPGLLRRVRAVLTPSPADSASAGEGQSSLPHDDAIVLAQVRARGRLEREQIERALGARRARAAVRDLLERREIALGVELAPGLARARRERVARLVGSPEAVEAWRAAARLRLDALRPAGAMVAHAAGATEERRAERLLRQLAVLDVLSRTRHAGHGAQRDGGDGARDWRQEELRRLTRATAPALRELAEAGLIALEERRARHDPLAGRSIPATQALPLNDEQARALDAITQALDAAHPGAAQGQVFVLHGVTGSGKTEVYLQALAATLARGRQCIALVPEIALTPQAVARFAGRFPGRVALLHSGLTDAERLDEWRRIRAGEVDIVVGSRSALFAPLERLGLIVVDEEHEGAYKEERAPTYHAREVAVRLGALAGAPVVLGSATPSVESYWLAREGVYTLLELRERAGGASAPEVTIVDLRAELRAGNTSILSEPLRAALDATLERREQAILFLNRRGMASSVICRECGYVARCPNCDVSLTFHASERALLCHYCGRSEAQPQVCPICWSASIRYFGLGTERVEEAVKRQFPAARVLRWDRDTARTRQAHEDLLRAFAERRADVLVGTQMIAKGLDLPGVTLVGVISADVALYLPDFRASERAFQLLTQVAGRAGRGRLAGRALVQTFSPEHFCIQTAAQGDYAEFFAAELAARQRYGYPPLRRFVTFAFESPERYTAQVEALALADRLERLIAALRLPATDLVGPAPALLERLRGQYRWHIILRSPDPRPLLDALLAEPLPRGWSFDVDPLHTA